jgi:hypothetical protein
MVLRDPDSLPMVLSLTGWGGFVVRQAVIQGVSVQSAGNFHFLHTLRGYVYVYVFGERIGNLIITGLAFNGSCITGGYLDGISRVINYYDAFRVSRGGAAIGIQIGAAGFNGFLVGTSFRIANPEARIGQFQLNFNITPPVF